MKPIPPTIVKRMLEKVGYILVAADDCAWIMESKGRPAVIPQTMKLVPLDVLESIIDPDEISEEMFAKLLEEFEKPPAAKIAK